MPSHINPARLGLLVACAAAALVLGSGEAGAREPMHPPSVSLERTAPDSHWVVGQVTVAAPPDVIWSRLQNVADWPRLITDIERLKVVERRGPRWEVELETRTLGHGSLDYHVDFAPGRSVRFWRTGSGVAAQGYLTVRDGPSEREANIVYRLYISLSGLPRLLISDDSMREKQEHMVTVTLGDLYRAYPPR